MLPFIGMFILLCLCANIVYTRNCVPCFEDLIKSLINGLSLRVVSKPNLLRKVRFEVFRNIIIYPWIKTKPVIGGLALYCWLFVTVTIGSLTKSLYTYLLEITPISEEKSVRPLPRYHLHHGRRWYRSGPHSAWQSSPVHRHPALLRTQGQGYYLPTSARWTFGTCRPHPR